MRQSLYSLGTKVTADIKTAIDAEAKRSGQTQSQVVERLIKEALEVQRLPPAIHRWSIALHYEFDSAGTAAAKLLGIDVDESHWADHPSCLLCATMAVIDWMLRDLERRGGVDCRTVSTALEQSAMRPLAVTGWSAKRAARRR